MERKWTYLMFAAGGMLLAFLLLKIGDWAWAFYGTKPNSLAIGLFAFGLAGAASYVAVRNERVFLLASEVTAEMAKVSWPTRQETGAATIVVIVTVIVASIILGIFDTFWGWFTQVIFNG